MDNQGNVVGWDSLFKLLEAEDSAKAKGDIKLVEDGAKRFRKRRMKGGEYRIK